MYQAGSLAGGVGGGGERTDKVIGDGTSRVTGQGRNRGEGGPEGDAWTVWLAWPVD